METAAKNNNSNSKSNNNNNGKEVTKTIAGKQYTLVIKPREPPLTWPQTFSATIKTVFMLPIALPFAFAWTIAMATPLRPKILSKLVPTMMANVGKIFQSERKTLLKDVAGRVLDVGCGSGAYFSLFQSADEIVAVEPVPTLHPIIREEHAKALDASKTKLTILPDMDAAIETEAAESFDWIILGNVLCEVPLPIEDTLRQVDRLLKPGGMVYFSEHIGSPAGTWTRTFQNAIVPWWRHVHGGCNCNRDSLLSIRAQSNWDVVSWNCEHFRIVGNIFVFGLAQKQGAGVSVV